MNKEEINRLFAIEQEGHAAREALNEYVGEIYDHYMEEIERQKEELKKEYPAFDERISELERCNQGFHKFYIGGDQLHLVGSDYFRGEQNIEEDTLPLSIFGADNWRELVNEHVTTKISHHRNQLKRVEEQEEINQRYQYEQLKQKYEGDK